MQGCRRFLLFSLLALAACSASPKAQREPASAGAQEYALAKLRERGASESFLELLQSEYRPAERDRVIDLNLLGFLRSRPAQDERIPAYELRKVQQFLRKNKGAFASVERKFPVPKEVIASLLWVETKHGRDLGRFHVGSAFFSLVQAYYPPLVDQTIELARQRAEDFNPEIEKKVIERSQAKSEWALTELLALQEIHEKGYKDVRTLEGSFSGAMGMAQFLPSSYLAWARAKGGNRQPNLFRADDAIFSVANYLTTNGWKKKSREDQEAALFHYNRDRSYVNRILRMGDCLRLPSKRRSWLRRPASGC